MGTKKITKLLFILAMLLMATMSRAMRVHAEDVTVTGGVQNRITVSSAWQTFMGQDNVRIVSTMWTTNEPNVITLRFNTNTYCDFYPAINIGYFNGVEIRFTIICTESGVYKEYELYWNISASSR